MIALLSLVGFGGIGAALAFIPGALPAAMKALRAAVGATCKYPLQVALIVALCAVAWFWRAERRAVDALDAFKAETVAAQVEAGRKAIAVKLATEAHYKDLANDADKEHAAALVAAHDATARYIAAHRVRIDGSRASGGTVASAESGGAQGGNRPGAPSDMVAVTSDDMMICTENTTRLQAVRDWAVQLGK